MLRTIFTCDAEVEAIAYGFFDRTLPKTQWTHAAHFAVCVWVLARRPDLDASVVLPSKVRAYNEATGTPNTETSGYHETITQASIRAARRFIASGEYRSLFVICNALLASRLGRSDWLLAYWSPELLFSTEARAAWVDPDLAPLPFASAPTPRGRNR
jgi:hypothetical protein